MSTKAVYDGGVLNFWDSATAERVAPMAPVVFYDDFLGSDGLKVATNGALWTAKDTGDATEAVVADEANGVVALSLTATEEKQEAGIYWGDQRTLVAGQGLVFEARVKVSTTPTLVAEAVWGLASDFVETGDAVANNAFFKVDGSTSILCESDNATLDVDDTDSGIVAGTTTWRVYRIDASNVDDVRFFIDGARVCATTTFKVLAATLLQPYFYVFKASGAGLGVVKIDYVRVWQKRS